MDYFAARDGGHCLEVDADDFGCLGGGAVVGEAGGEDLAPASGGGTEVDGCVVCVGGEFGNEGINEGAMRYWTHYMSFLTSRRRG